MRNSAEPFIYTLPDNALDFLPANNLALRDVRAINLQLAQVKSMTITAGSVPPVTLARSAGGTWTPANVKDRMVDSTKADEQASLFCQLQAKAWLGPVLPAYGLAKPFYDHIPRDRPRRHPPSSTSAPPFPMAVMPRRCQTTPLSSRLPKATTASSTRVRSSSSPTSSQAHERASAHLRHRAAPAKK